MTGPLVQHQFGVVFFLVAVLLITLSNLGCLKKLGARKPVRFPRVSILVPARNEEENIAGCLASLLSQDYPDFEVIVLDDCSTDATLEKTTVLAAGDARLRVLEGKPLPEGWPGKHWACQQLADAADGRLLLFTDADTRHSPFALRDAVCSLTADGLDFLTAFPRQKVASAGEILTVPIIGFSIVSFIPFALAYRWGLPSLSAAIGQFMLFDRNAYEAVGGHAAVRNTVVDDFGLARKVKEYGFRWRFYEGADQVRCRMYSSGLDAFRGLGKNLFSVFGYHTLFFLFVWFWLGVVFLEPTVILVLQVAGVAVPWTSLLLAAVGAGLGLLLWSLAMVKLGYPVWIALVHPLVILTSITVALYSMVQAYTGNIRWKGRTLDKPRIHLI